DMTAGATRDRQCVATRVLLRHLLDGLLGLPQLSGSAAIGCERAGVEDGQQVHPMQLGCDVLPLLLRVAVQMLGRWRAFLGACRFERDGDSSLSRVALKQAETWMFR